MYGYHHLPLLIFLQDLGLLTRSPPPTPQHFPALRKSLRLVVNDIDDAAPNDISYVYSGYAPLSIRLVQCITQKNAILSGAADVVEEGGNKKAIPQAHPIVGWKGFEDVVGSIPGTTVDIRQKAKGGERRQCPCNSFRIQLIDSRPTERADYDYRGVLPWRMYIYRDFGVEMDVETD